MGQLFFKKPLQDAIRDGRKRTTIRRWREGKPGVHVGQRVYSPGLGWLTIERVERVQLETLGDSDARADGFDDAAGLRAALMSLYPEHRATSPTACASSRRCGPSATTPWPPARRCCSTTASTTRPAPT